MNDDYFVYLKKHRQMRGYTLKEIGAVLNLTHAAIWLMENGRRRLPMEYAMKLADFYGITVDELLGRSGDDGRI